MRFWIWWKARQQNLTVKVDKIDAPFLRPVTLRGVRVKSSADSAFRVELVAAQATLSLNFKTILFRARGRALRNLSITGLRAEIHHNFSGTPFPKRSWATWQKLLPHSGKLDGFDVRLEDGPTVILLRGSSLSLSEIEAGRVVIEELMISSPHVRQTFSRLRGATRWQENHLTLAGLNLTHGLDVQSITADLSHLRKQHLGLEFDIDAFGGKLRGNISNEWRSRQSNWTIAGSAADISLTQTAEAIGFADRVAGRLHAGKFTFRGDLRAPMQATASLWAELTAPAWRNRQADVIMAGVAFYNRQIVLQQLYVKQSKNELTLSGEAPLPNKLSDWLSADFRANISASINNLGDFARLFGANPDQFGGQISIEGTINSHGKKLDGQVSASGKSLLFFHSPIDLFSTRLNLTPGVVEIAEFHLKHDDDYVRVEGKIDMAHDRHPVGSIELFVRRLSDYFPKTPFAGSLQGRFNVNGRGASSDSLQFSDGPVTVSFGSTIDFSDVQNVHLLLTPLHPLLDLSVPSASDCIDRVQLQPVPKKSKQPPPPIDKFELNGDFLTGLRQIKLTTAAGQKEYRVLCPEPGNRALPIGVAPKKR